MPDPLKIKRIPPPGSRGGNYLSVSKTDGRYNVAVTGGGNLTIDELAQVEAYIGGDPDGQGTLEKLRARG